MIKCLIVEDELPAQKILTTYINDAPTLQLEGCCNNALDAMASLQNAEIQLLFLDIHLPKLSGLSFLRSLKDPPKVIITTAYPEYALEGFELDVLDYLLKPFSFERFVKAVNKYEVIKTAPVENQLIPDDYQSNHIFIKKEKSFLKILLKEIHYIESDKDLVKIHCADKIHIELQSLKFYENSLPHNFIRVHKSFIINLNSVASLEGNRLLIKNQMVPVGRSFKDALLKKLGLS